MRRDMALPDDHRDPGGIVMSEVGANLGVREKCPERNGDLPHMLLSRRFGGSFCRACDKFFSKFHMHNGKPCDCEPLLKPAAVREALG